MCMVEGKQTHAQNQSDNPRAVLSQKIHGSYTSTMKFRPILKFAWPVFLFLCLMLFSALLHTHAFDFKVHPECVTCSSAQHIVTSAMGALLLVGLSFLICVALFQKECPVQALHFRFFLRAPPRA